MNFQEYISQPKRIITPQMKFEDFLDKNQIIGQTAMTLRAIYLEALYQEKHPRQFCGL